MAADAEAENLTGGDRWNYFNYFTEIEEHFQQARGSGLFLLSPLDWALIENWKNAGIPLEAVLRGIDAAFEKWHARKRRFGQVNSVAYCAQAVHDEAEAMAKGGASGGRGEAKPPFRQDEVAIHLEKAIAKLGERAEYGSVIQGLRDLRANLDHHFGRLEELEQRLTALEDKMSAVARSSVSDEMLLQSRRELDASLKPYRSKMTAEQLSLLERQYLDRWVIQRADLPRLSLFYLE
jgi:hypothetical protein